MTQSVCLRVICLSGTTVGLLHAQDAVTDESALHANNRDITCWLAARADY